jgi:hypothetical protein
LPISWDNDINDDVGSESVSIRDNALSAEDCQALCGLMRSLQMKADASGASTRTEAHGLQGSFGEEGALSNEEMEAIVKNWTFVEDDPCVIGAEIEEATNLLETEAEDHMADLFGDDDNEPESVDAVVVEGEERPVLSILS